MDDDTFRTGVPVAGPVTLDFDAGGRAAAIRFGTVEQVLTEPIYLLIGEVDAVGIRSGTIAENVTNPNARWVQANRSADPIIKQNGWAVSSPSLADSRSL
jgi:hypothetical protein